MHSFVTQANRLTKISGLDTLTELQELYLSENGITKIENLEYNTKLDTLDLAQNKITTIQGISHLQTLEEFWVRYSRISVFCVKHFFFGPFKKFNGLTPCTPINKTHTRLST